MNKSIYANELVSSLVSVGPTPWSLCEIWILPAEVSQAISVWLCASGVSDCIYMWADFTLIKSNCCTEKDIN